jgi:hypothetical protein
MKMPVENVTFTGFLFKHLLWTAKNLFKILQ